MDRVCQMLERVCGVLQSKYATGGFAENDVLKKEIALGDPTVLKVCPLQNCNFWFGRRNQASDLIFDDGFKMVIEVKCLHESTQGSGVPLSHMRNGVIQVVEFACCANIPNAMLMVIDQWQQNIQGSQGVLVGSGSKKHYFTFGNEERRVCRLMEGFLPENGRFMVVQYFKDRGNCKTLLS